MDQKPLTLWTCQMLPAWEVAQQRGELRADGRRVWVAFRPAYQWLRDQMAVRLPGLDERYPIWAWPEKPDLRRAAHLPRGSAGVCIEFRLSASKVLLLSFDAWHAVLNNWYLALSEQERHAWAAKCSARPRSQSCQAEVEASWERVFDLELLKQHGDWWGDPLRVQAVLRAVPLSCVVRVRHFRAR